MAREKVDTYSNVGIEYGQRLEATSINSGRAGFQDKEGESGKPLNRVVLIETIDGEGGSTTLPFVINETEPEDSLSHFIIVETKDVHKRIKDLENRRATIGKRKTHQRERRTRVTKEARESLTGEINREKEKLSILEGRVWRPLKLIRKKDRIVGCEVRSFGSEEETEFWRFVSGKIFEIVEIAKKDPEAVDLLVEGFGYRWRMRHAPKEEAEEAKRQFFDFLGRLQEMPDDKITLTTPILRMMTEKFGKGKVKS